MISFRQVLCVGLLALLTASPAIAEVRTWTDSTGKFSVKAEFIEVSNGKAVLKRADSGKEVRLPLVRLSKSDQLLIRQILAERRKQAKEAKESEDSDDANRAARRADDADATEPSDDPVAEEEPEDKEVVENKPAVAVKPPAVEPPTRPAPRIALPERRPPNNVINSVRGAVYRTQTLNNLKQLGLALMSYESARGRYPTSAIYTPEGKPGLSWRVALLPYLEEQGLYRQFHLNEPWDSPHNRELARQMPAVFKSPGSDLDDGYTNYLAVVGDDTIITFDRKGVQLRQVRDGTSMTVALVEADDAYATIWTKPDDYVVDPNEPAYGLGGIWSGMFFCVKGDGAPTSMPLSIDVETLNGLFTRSGGEPVSLP